MKLKDLSPGTVVHGIRIDAEAGRGGSSVVYRGTELATGRQLAVKVLSTSDPSSRRRLAREAELLATVSHPAIVPFRGLRQTDDADILLTDWVDGESLLESLRKSPEGSLSADRQTGPMSTADALNILRALADPLDHLHELDIVHRDISPSNIIVGLDGSLTIIDLGIGHHIDSSTMTSDDLLAGTPKYLAPELIRGENATGQADQYSVGVLVHELITGQSPFPAADKIATALHHQLHSVPVPLDEVDHRIPSRVADAVLRSLQKNPEDRFQSVTEFAEIASGLGVTGVNGGAPTAGVPDERRRLLPVIAAVVLIVVGAAGAALWRLSGDRAGDELTTGGRTTSAVSDVGSQTQPADADQRSTLVVEDTGQATAATSDGVADDSPGDASTGDSGEAGEAAGTPWQDGTAASLGCNLLQGASFTDGSVPIDYFGDPPGRERVVTDLGFDQSWALEIGQVGAFGQYGEIVPIQTGETYLFHGWFDRRGEIADAELGISFLTADYQPLSTGAQGSVPVGEAGFAEVVAIPAPDGAGFAVPYLFKDGSEGVLIADELVFGPLQSCGPQITSRKP